MQTAAGINEAENKWKFAQCFGDKGESDDITEGNNNKTHRYIDICIYIYKDTHKVKLLITC